MKMAFFLQGHKEWVTEVKFLGVVEHPNLVKLLGYCADDDERGIQRFLIYEYMPNGSVYDHLSTQSGKTLSWAWRMRIARDTARGLAYLHEEMDFQVRSLPLFFLFLAIFILPSLSPPPPDQFINVIFLADNLQGLQVFKYSSG